MALDRRTVLAALTAAVAGCGGGGSNDGPATIAAAPNPTAAPTPAPSPTPAPTSPPAQPSAAAVDFAANTATGAVFTGTAAAFVDPYTSARVGVTAQTALTAPIPVGDYVHTVSAYASPINGTGTLLQLDDGTDNNRVTLRMAGFQLFATSVGGGGLVSDLYLGRVLPTAIFNVGVSVIAGAMQASLNGKPIVSGPAGAVAPSRVVLGAGVSGAWGGTVATYQRLLAAGASVQVPVAGLFDDFDRADGALGVPPTGQVYQQAVPWPLGPVQANGYAKIASKRLVTLDSGLSVTASYNGVDLGAPASQFMAAVSFSAGNLGSGNATLIAEANGLRRVQDITDAAIHIGFLDNQVQVQQFAAGAFSVLRTIPYSAPVVRDGVTVYNVGWRLVGTQLILLLPDGTLTAIAAPSLPALNGRFVIYESFWQGVAASRSNFSAVSVR